jgi:hypothetical protein
VQLLGVNEAGHESGNADMVAGRTLPLLQDVAGADVWTRWAVEYRDVVIVDGASHRRGVFNVTVRNLSDPANRAALKAQLLGAR